VFTFRGRVFAEPTVFRENPHWVGNLMAIHSTAPSLSYSAEQFDLNPALAQPLPQRQTDRDLSLFQSTAVLGCAVNTVNRPQTQPPAFSQERSTSTG